MKISNRKTLILTLLVLLVPLQVFAGSFYTATLYPKENTEDVKSILQGKNFFICSKAGDYNLVTEEKMDEQNSAVILDFVKKISLKTEKPVVSYIIHDSDVLWFVIYKNGKQIFVLDNSAEYFSGGNFVLKGKDEVHPLFKINKKQWKTEISKEKFRECVFADEYLIKILDILNLPNWVEGIGYSYLSNDEKFVLHLKERGIIIERY
ncbi:hypothetical protein [Treponema zioleckii]|uniref:hypothetical protein n=1 Tax=Treponema zioleckii TaxID=331680 RepID=UPI00168A4EF6|nr:hypothetical protein [Treponema zioleckii]